MYTITHTRLRPAFVAACAVEKGVEVIDDLYGESLEIKEAGNTWLTYGPPMQLARVRYIPIARAHIRTIYFQLETEPLAFACACSTSG